MAHKKGVGSSDNGRDSKSKRLGVKLFGGQYASAGNIIVRQRGTKFHPGENTYLGKDFTLHARIDGVISFKKAKDNKNYVSILPLLEEVAETVAPIANAKPAAEAKPEVKEKAEVTEKAVAKEKAAPKEKSVAKEKPAAKEKAVPAEKAVAKDKAASKAKATPKASAKTKGDDLTKVEGIGPKIAELFHAAGIMTFADLAKANVDKLKEILSEAGSNFATHDPTSWPQQSALAADGKWDELKQWQDELDGGKPAAGEEE